MKVNVYGGGSLDRAALWRGDPDWLAAQLNHPSTRLVPVWRSRILIARRGTSVLVQCPLRTARQEWIDAGHQVYFLGLQDSIPHFAIDLSPAPDPEALLSPKDAAEFADLRDVGTLLPQPDGSMLAYARGLIHWHQTHPFCNRCGAPTTSRQGGHMRQCTNPQCHAEHYPRTDPAVIVLVSAGEHCLLGRQARWRPGMFSTLAGFVEPAETLEEAVVREVMEETGVKVGSLRYHSSQPWPFPCSLMVGFHAEADAVTPLSVDTNELETAEWFTRADIARFAEQGRSLPNPDSIARRLLEDWLERRV
ncbi:NAD(+) diphosphatase [Telmatospirillum sp.]|uniref:NAD(+) diphosphatase n=1 Tax=Telmatospirillum sp. TaxID=2079197 RepID=UPI002849709B|nr:NAD(+) diphosphatase [Telmatospirillum sp.]MDR3439132.1 NAD(+) diphosphatase [Telmatospirillum sp.]